MNITPEQILELAEWAEDTASYFDTTDEHGYIICEAEEEKQIYLQISACLKSYAEILPKWQAVLDAEPVASYEKYDDMGGRCCLYDLGCPASNDGEVFLIIKPAP